MAHALIDTLVAAGLLSDSDAGTNRVMLGMFTRATGDDQANATVEVNAEGHTLVNGQRLR